MFMQNQVQTINSKSKKLIKENVLMVKKKVSWQKTATNMKVFSLTYPLPQSY